ncbi:hypothetical protein CPB84DRAFT_1752709 [Gymnopilus junonius]|uniref:Uncharacterized protein n=1 Tax=Gymnopilus junonius TaxID=109634 RepID=A0A9P5N8V7_GYMJU|nr:hypothetical protein CPB84DRAFT_1752709 [Gymnopilus junonius]
MRRGQGDALITRGDSHDRHLHFGIFVSLVRTCRRAQKVPNFELRSSARPHEADKYPKVEVATERAELHSTASSDASVWSIRVGWQNKNAFDPYFCAPSPTGGRETLGAMKLWVWRGRRDCCVSNQVRTCGRADCAEGRTLEIRNVLDGRRGGLSKFGTF